MRSLSGLGSPGPRPVQWRSEHGTRCHGTTITDSPRETTGRPVRPGTSLQPSMGLGYGIRFQLLILSCFFQSDFQGQLMAVPPEGNRTPNLCDVEQYLPHLSHPARFSCYALSLLPLLSNHVKSGCLKKEETHLKRNRTFCLIKLIKQQGGADQ